MKTHRTKAFIAAFDNIAEKDKVVESGKRNGYDVSIFELQLNDKKFFRVVWGA